MSKASRFRLSTLIVFQINTPFLNCTALRLLWDSLAPDHFNRSLALSFRSGGELWRGVQGWSQLGPNLPPPPPPSQESQHSSGPRGAQDLFLSVSRSEQSTAFVPENVEHASSCKMCNIRTNPLQTCAWNLSRFFFWVFSRKALENHPKASAVCVSTRPIVSCCSVCPVRSERLRLHCGVSGSRCPSAFLPTTPPFPQCYWTFIFVASLQPLYLE